jgi:DNA mismatch endonuclease Vsr
MVDFVSAEKRSNIMRGSRSKDTRPELSVRRALHGLGYRYSVHGKGLPGRPDLVFSARRKVILVHGCFWHQHVDEKCAVARNTDFWNAKFKRNRERDADNLKALAEAGWDVLTVWECELADQKLVQRLTQFLGPQRFFASPQLKASPP